MIRLLLLINLFVCLGCSRKDESLEDIWDSQANRQFEKCDIFERSAKGIAMLEYGKATKVRSLVCEDLRGVKKAFVVESWSGDPLVYSVLTNVEGSKDVYAYRYNKSQNEIERVVIYYEGDSGKYYSNFFLDFSESFLCSDDTDELELYFIIEPED